MSFKIVSDSSANLHSINSDIPFASVPLKIIAGTKEFVDDTSLNLGEMLHHLANHNGKSGSSCPSVSDWMDAFGDADNVICFTITSNLSGAYNSANQAKMAYEEANPGKKVFVVDSLSTGPEMKLLIEKAVELIKKGLDFEGIRNAINKYKEKTALIFSLESLRNLANNGRVSPLTAKVAGVLGIRVVGKASDVGTLEPMDKCRGAKKAVEKLLSRMQEMGFRGGKVRIDQCENTTDAKNLKDIILAKHPNADVIIDKVHGLCSFYAEKGGLLVGFEKMGASI